MGGIGSGRTWNVPPPCCEDCIRIDFASMRRRGLLRPGRTSVLTFSSAGRKAVSVLYSATKEGVQFGPEFIRYVCTKAPFKSLRKWFACPGCERPCRVLYGYRGSLRCRTCHGLKYQSQYSNDLARSFAREDKLRRQIGERLQHQFEDGDDFPPKPKKMRWVTYRRLAESWARGGYGASSCSP